MWGVWLLEKLGWFFLFQIFWAYEQMYQSAKFKFLIFFNSLKKRITCLKLEDSKFESKNGNDFLWVFFFFWICLLMVLNYKNFQKFFWVSLCLGTFTKLWWLDFFFLGKRDGKEQSGTKNAFRKTKRSWFFFFLKPHLLKVRHLKPFQTQKLYHCVESEK